MRKLFAPLIVMILVAGLSLTASANHDVWFQDFEDGAGGWFDNDDVGFTGYGNITAAGGVATVTELTTGPFSRFGGYSSVWPGTWTAELDVYLDPAWTPDEGFDYSVAANGTDGIFQRDFVFNIGVVSGEGLLVNVSTQSDSTVNPVRLMGENDAVTYSGSTYYEVTTSGWYTLQHVFRDASGVLEVDLNLLAGDGAQLWTAAISDPADTIPAEVGGNRYAWFTYIHVDGGVTIDNHRMYLGTSHTADYIDACLFAGSLSQVGADDPNCGRGTLVQLVEGDDISACLHAGRLTQVGSTDPNCGRGEPISLAFGDGLYACLYAGSLSRVGSEQSSCGRGDSVGLAGGFVID